MKRNQLTALLVAVVLFCFGTTVGALAHRFYASTAVNARSAEDFRQHYVAEMRSKVNLTSSQVSQLETILDETKAKFKAVRDSYHPAMLKIKQEQINRVKSILTPQQIPAYERLVAEHEQRVRDQEEHDRVREQRRALRQSDSGH